MEMFQRLFDSQILALKTYFVNNIVARFLSK